LARAPGLRADVGPAACAAHPKNRAKPGNHRADDDSRSPSGQDCLRFSQPRMTGWIFEQTRTSPGSNASGFCRTLAFELGRLIRSAILTG
jgi:hypothetical protein